MSPLETDPSDEVCLDIRIEDVLDYRAPFLIEKLVKNCVADTAEEAEELFQELKKYLILSRSDETPKWQMYSARVDEVWHQFILYTEAYTTFCENFFGGYVGHSPSNAPELDATDRSGDTSSLEGFRCRYIEIFGSQLPELWYDEKTVRLGRRIFNDSVGQWIVWSSADQMVDLVGLQGNVLMSVDEIARPALEFIAGTKGFFVRELPGGLTDEEKIGLISALVGYRLLRVGA